jgi:hypothetical protein
MYVPFHDRTQGIETIRWGTVTIMWSTDII